MWHPLLRWSRLWFHFSVRGGIKLIDLGIQMEGFCISTSVGGWATLIWFHFTLIPFVWELLQRDYVFMVTKMDMSLALIQRTLAIGDQQHVNVILSKAHSQIVPPFWLSRLFMVLDRLRRWCCKMSSPSSSVCGCGCGTTSRVYWHQLLLQENI